MGLACCEEDVPGACQGEQKSENAARGAGATFGASDLPSVDARTERSLSCGCPTCAGHVAPSSPGVQALAWAALSASKDAGHAEFWVEDERCDEGCHAGNGKDTG